MKNPKIEAALRANGLIGRSYRLWCNKHIDQWIAVGFIYPEDARQIPDGAYDFPVYCEESGCKAFAVASF